MDVIHASRVQHRFVSRGCCTEVLALLTLGIESAFASFDHPLFHPLGSKASGSQWKPVGVKVLKLLDSPNHYRPPSLIAKVDVAGSNPVSRSRFKK